MQNGHSVLLKLLMNQLTERLFQSKPSNINQSRLNSRQQVPLTSSQTYNIEVSSDRLHLLEHLQNYVMIRMSETDVSDRINEYRRTHSVHNTKAERKRKSESDAFNSACHRSSKKSRKATLPQSSTIRRSIRV